MKRKFVTVLALTLALSLVGCGNDKNATNTETQQTETEIVTETQETETTVETETEVVEETEPEITLLETVEFSDNYTTATKTVYSNETADYEVWAKIPYWNAEVHYKIPDMLTNGEAFGLESVSIVSFTDPTKDDGLKVKVWAYENISSSQIDLKNMSDNQLGTLDGTNPDLSTMEKIETDTIYTVGVQFECQDFGTTCMAYNYYVNDYANDKAYYITVNGSGEYADYDFLYNLAHSVEIIELN